MNPETKNLIYRSIFAYKKADQEEKNSMLKILKEKINIHSQLCDLSGYKTQKLIACEVFMRIYKKL
mgnify:CR=1 FL=1